MTLKATIAVWARRVCDPRDTKAAWVVARLLLIAEAVLCSAIIAKVPCASRHCHSPAIVAPPPSVSSSEQRFFHPSGLRDPSLFFHPSRLRHPSHLFHPPDTMIDWDAYMAQATGFQHGERDYAKLEGDTGRPRLMFEAPKEYASSIHPPCLPHLPDTKIDWDAYMAQVTGFQHGERDYTKLEGDTGPLVYPAGFLLSFSALKWITGGVVANAQITGGVVANDQVGSWLARPERFQEAPGRRPLARNLSGKALFVYPAKFLLSFSALKWITGEIVPNAQVGSWKVAFLVLYLINLLMVFAIYIRTQAVRTNSENVVTRTRRSLVGAFAGSTACAGLLHPSSCFLLLPAPTNPHLPWPPSSGAPLGARAAVSLQASARHLPARLSALIPSFCTLHPFVPLHQVPPWALVLLCLSKRLLFIFPLHLSPLIPSFPTPAQSVISFLYQVPPWALVLLCLSKRLLFIFPLHLSPLIPSFPTPAQSVISFLYQVPPWALVLLCLSNRLLFIFPLHLSPLIPSFPTPAQSVISFLYQVPPWVLVLLCLSKRLHSIFLLRLFNDCLAMAFLHASLLRLQSSRWIPAVLLFSAGVSVKMNVLLFLPPLLLIMAKTLPLLQIMALLGAAVAFQLLVGWPFISTFPQAYFGRAFDLGRVFIHFWSVNFKFVPKSTFVSKPFALSLLGLHLLLLLLFCHFCWCKYEGGMFRVAIAALLSPFKRLQTRPLHPDLLLPSLPPLHLSSPPLPSPSAFEFSSPPFPPCI
ncbi:unnamed protein product [Closterium sp. Naga37s-1]|nr:unnamed protein product [Closterium sp. Naga37s-1]